MPKQLNIGGITLMDCTVITAVVIAFAVFDSVGIQCQILHEKNKLGINEMHPVIYFARLLTRTLDYNSSVKFTTY